MIEHPTDGFVKMSFRSKGDFSVNEFAREHFSGGGHNNAAGGKSELSLLETHRILLIKLKQCQQDLQQA
jgi:phosphoesterase RecJ-like protein